MEIEVQKFGPRIILIDDDPSYCAILSRIAKEENISLTTFSSLEEMGSIGHLSNYDVAVVDYDLGKMNGVEVGEYLSSLFQNKPMVLVSGKERRNLPNKNWPDSIKAFVSKTKGYRQVLRKAILYSDMKMNLPKARHFGEK